MVEFEFAAIAIDEGEGLGAMDGAVSLKASSCGVVARFDVLINGTMEYLIDLFISGFGQCPALEPLGDWVHIFNFSIEPGGDNTIGNRV